MCRMRTDHSDRQTLVALKQKPNKEVIDCVKELLQKAEKGDIQAFAYASIHPSGATGNGWGGLGGGKSMALVGELRALEMDLLNYFGQLRSYESSS